MSDFLVPLNYDRARDVLRLLHGYTHFTPEGAEHALEVLHQHYPTVFGRMECKAFGGRGALLELGGLGHVAPMVFVSHLDAPEGARAVPCDWPMQAPLSRAHLLALLEALEELLLGGYLPGGDLYLAISLDGLSGGAGAKAMAEHLHTRGIAPCFVLDHGGYATLEAFKTYLPKDAPLALVGIAEKAELHGVLTATATGGGKPPVDALLQAGRRLTRHPRHGALCPESALMLKTLGRSAPFLQRWLVRWPRLTFPLLRLLWRKRAVMRQFFWSQRSVYALSANGSQHDPATDAKLCFTQTLIPSQRLTEYQGHLRAMVGDEGLCLTFPVENAAGSASEAKGEAWDALSTAIEIQFDRVVIVPCLCPFPTDARFYDALGGRAYRFSPFLISGREALAGLCTLTDSTLQTAVQFFRQMLTV